MFGSSQREGRDVAAGPDALWYASLNVDEAD